MAQARATLPRRPGAHDLPILRERGALVVDIRPTEQRQRDGELPGAVVIDRNVLEWRLDPTSPHRIPEASSPDLEIVLVCNEGYASSLAAASLQRLGLRGATDLDGGFQAVLGLVAGAADLYVQADGGPRREREEAWSVLTQYLVGLARAERDWAAAERLQQAQVAVTRRLAADALVIPAPQCTLVQRNRIRTLSVSAHDLGEILRERGDPGCVEHYQEAMDLAAGIGDNIGESIAAFNLGTVYKDIPALRDLDQAEHWYQHCLDLVGDKAPIRRARSLNQLGTVALNRLNDAITAHQPVEINRHLTDAGRRYQEALRLFPPDDIADLAVTHSQLGTVYRHAGDIPRAFEHYQRSIKYEIAMGDRFSAGATRFNIALLFATHRAADALLYAQAALADYESYGGGAQQQAEQARALIAALEQT